MIVLLALSLCHLVMLYFIVLCNFVSLWYITYVVFCAMQISDVEVKQRLDKLTEELHQNESLTEVSDESF